MRGEKEKKRRVRDKDKRAKEKTVRERGSREEERYGDGLEENTVISIRVRV